MIIKNFDTFAAIDWSGAKSPEKSRALAVAYCSRGQASPRILDHPLKRLDVSNWIESRLILPGRCLIGIDCNFGYSEEVGQIHFGERYTYLDVWQAVEMSSQYLPDFFAEGFWQHEVYGHHFWTSGPKPQNFNILKPRMTEAVCRDKGHGHPESPFKLIGPKQVGKGGLAGMRMLYSLKKKFGQQICVWPFEVHTDEAKIVIAEIYPRLFLKASGFEIAKIRNVADLNRALSFFKSEGMKGGFTFTDHIADAVVSSAALRLMASSGTGFPEILSKPPQMTKNIALREGWILGV